MTVEQDFCRSVGNLFLMKQVAVMKEVIIIKTKRDVKFNIHNTPMEEK